MTTGLTAIVLLGALSRIQALQPVSFVTVEVGANVTFTCPHSENMGDIFYWYKMKFGSIIETIVEGVGGVQTSPPRVRLIRAELMCKSQRLEMEKFLQDVLLNVQGTTRIDSGSFESQISSGSPEQLQSNVYIGMGYFGELSLRGHFKNVRFRSVRVGHTYFLNISSVNKEDEATYTCQAGTSYNMRFIHSMHLLVKDYTHKSFHVKQIPQAKSVEAGQSVLLQCSILSGRRHNVSRCPDNQNVYWFKSGLGDSSPHIIYTDGDDEKARGSCVYHLYKLIQNSSDSGTYYCAVATCGEILFGQGTHVETRQNVKLVGIVLGALLASAVTVVAVVSV